MSTMLVGSSRWEQHNSWASRQLLMPKCADHNTLRWTLWHSEYVNGPIFLTTYNMQRIPSSSKSVQKLTRTIDVSTKAVFTWTLRNISFLSKLTSLLFKQSLHCSGNHWLESSWTPSHECPTQQKHYHFIFLICFHILIISKLHSLYLDIHVGLMFKNLLYFILILNFY